MNHDVAITTCDEFPILGCIWFLFLSSGHVHLFSCPCGFVSIAALLPGWVHLFCVGSLMALLYSLKLTTMDKVLVLKTLHLSLEHYMLCKSLWLLFTYTSVYSTRLKLHSLTCISYEVRINWRSWNCVHALKIILSLWLIRYIFFNTRMKFWTAFMQKKISSWLNAKESKSVTPLTYQHVQSFLHYCYQELYSPDSSGWNVSEAYLPEILQHFHKTLIHNALCSLTGSKNVRSPTLY